MHPFISNSSESILTDESFSCYLCFCRSVNYTLLHANLIPCRDELTVTTCCCLRELIKKRPHCILLGIPDKIVWVNYSIYLSCAVKELYCILLYCVKKIIPITNWQLLLFVAFSLNNFKYAYNYLPISGI